MSVLEGRGLKSFSPPTSRPSAPSTSTLLSVPSPHPSGSVVPAESTSVIHTPRGHRGASVTNMGVGALHQLLARARELWDVILQRQGSAPISSPGQTERERLEKKAQATSSVENPLTNVVRMTKQLLGPLGVFWSLISYIMQNKTHMIV